MQMTTHHGEFVYYPTNHVIGIINAADDASAAVEALHAAGYGDDRLHVLAGHEAAQLFDVDGSKHGLIARIARRVQSFGDLETPTLRRHVDEIEKGHYFVAVETDGSEDAVHGVRDLLKAHKAHYLYHYGTLGVTPLDI